MGARPATLMRAPGKRAAEWLLTAGGVSALARRRLRGRVAVLAYHNVVLDEEAGRGDASLHLPLSLFAEQLARLRRTHDIVSLEEASGQDASARPRAVITFDDAYRGAVTLALPLLQGEGIPATMFVSPGLLGEESVWWDELAERGELTEMRRTECMFQCHGRADEVRAAGTGGPGSATLPRSYGISTAEELQANTFDGMSVGGHGWDHACLTSLGDSALHKDLADTLAWVGAFPGAAIPWLALPYGEGNAGIAALALELGYRGVLEIRGGLWRPRGVRSSVPRINVPAGLSSRGLVLRASGIL